MCSSDLITYPAAWGSEGIEARVAALCARAVDAVQSGYNILIVSDRLVDSERVAIPALLATSAVHQHLIRAGLRTAAGQTGRGPWRARGSQDVEGTVDDVS